MQKSPAPRLAIDAARGLASALGCSDLRLEAFHAGDQVTAADLGIAEEEGLSFVHEAGGPAEDRILARAGDQKTDLIVMATEGPHGVLDALRGSTTERVLRQAPCPLLAVPSR